MAVTVTANLTVFSEGQDNTGGTWVGASGAFDTEVKFMDTASWFYQTPKNGVGDGNFTPTASVDMSAADTHLYWAMKCDVFAFAELLNTTTTNSGLMVQVESSASDYVTWHVAGSDTWGGEWRQFVLDLNNTANTFSVTGTLDLSAVTKISFLTDISNSGNIRIIDNTNLNAVRFGTGLTLTGTTFNLVDAALDDELVANKYGVLKLIDGNVHCQGRVIIGDGATVTTYNSTDEEIVFVDAIVSSGLYQFNIVGSGNTSVVKGFVAKGAGAANFAYDASDTAADLTLSGSTFIRAGLVDFASTSDVQVCSFNNCDQIVPSTGIFQNITISNFVGTTGAILFPSTDVNIFGLSFLICDNGVEYDATSDATSPAFNDFTFDDEAGNYDVNNTSGAEISISKNNGSNPNSYNPGGDIVNFLGASVTTKITARDADDSTLISDARVLAWVTSGVNFPYQASVTIAGSGTTATVTHTTHGLSTNDNIWIEGANEENYVGAYQITVTGVSTYEYTTAESTGGSPATGTIVATFLLLNGDTVAGVISDTRVIGTDQPFDYRIRKSTTSPLYRQGKGSDTSTSTGGKDITVNLVSDE